MGLSVEHLIKIYYNLSLVIKIKEELYDSMIYETDISDEELNLMISDLEQLKNCMFSLKEHLKEKNKDFPKKDVLNQLEYYSMIDPYSMLLKKQKLNSNDELNIDLFLVDKKIYIN